MFSFFKSQWESWESWIEVLLRITWAEFLFDKNESCRPYLIHRYIYTIDTTWYVKISAQGGPRVALRPTNTKVETIAISEKKKETW